MHAIWNVYTMYGRVTRSQWRGREVYAENWEKTARIAALQGRLICDEVHRRIRAYRSTMRITTVASPNKLMFGQELCRKLPEARRHTEHPDDAMVRKCNREQKEKWRSMPTKEDIQLQWGLKWAIQFYASNQEEQSDAPIRPSSDSCHWDQGRHDHS